MIDITWLGHGTFQIALESGEVILIDPWLTGNPKHPEGHELKRLDVMLITHGHFDHIADAIEVARRFNPTIIANYEICTWLEKQGVARACGMNKGGGQDAGPIRVTMTHALHSSSLLDDGRLIYGGEPGGFILHFKDGRNAYFAGDTAVMAEMSIYAELYQPQIAFLPVGDLYTMGPKEAALATRMLKVNKVIPMHYGTFPPLTGTPAELQALVKDLGVEVWTLEPGKTVQW